MGNWTVYLMTTLIEVIGRALIAAAGGAFAGLVVAVVYNIVAGELGELKIYVE
jgi:hypothetical protein